MHSCSTHQHHPHIQPPRRLYDQPFQKYLQQQQLVMAQTLRELLETLPQELHDQIYDEVFMSKAGIVVVSRKYKLPSVLQVDRATRSKLLGPYLNKSVFVAESFEDRRVIHSMPLHLLNEIKSIHTVTPGVPADETLADYCRKRASDRWRKVFDASFLHFSKESVRTKLDRAHWSEY